MSSWLAWNYVHQTGFDFVMILLSLFPEGQECRYESPHLASFKRFRYVAKVENQRWKESHTD